MSEVFEIESTGTKIIGRLVGFINDEECTALINSDDAHKKVFTSESTTIRKNIGRIENKRFVVAVKTNNGNIAQSIFVSAKIKSLTWRFGIPELHCDNKKDYKFKEILAK